jgi:hypothetical protein
MQLSPYLGIQMNRIFFRALLVGSMVGTPIFAQRLALTPPMAWNSWNCFAGNIDETKIKQIVDALISTGMRDAGYIYVNLDDNWMANPARDNTGNLRADPTRFPNGIKGLADYIHSKNMKLGIYNDRGTMTCMNVPQSGGYGNEEKDAKTYASWDVDYLKYDNCNARGVIKDDYTKMGKALAASGRPIVYSICAWHTEEWMPQIGQLWRSTEDITATWFSASETRPGWSVLGNFDHNVDNYIFTRPGSWSDPDMLEVGNGKLTETENKAHFGLWALVASPLIAGNDVRNLPKTTLAILTDPEVIAIDQDSAGVQGRRIHKTGDQEVWVKPLGYDYDSYAVGLLNRSGSTVTMSIDWSDLRLDPSSVTVRDVWEKKDLGVTKDKYTAQVPSHGLVLLKVKGKVDPSATIWLSDLHIHSVTNGTKFLQVDKSTGGNSLKLGTKTYTKGLGANSTSRTEFSLRKKYEKLQADIGIDGEISSGSVVFQVFGDGTKIYESPIIKGGTSPVSIEVALKDVDSLALVVTDAGDGTTNDHADWAGAKLVATTSTSLLTETGASKTGSMKIYGQILVLDGNSSESQDLLIRNAKGGIVMRQRISGSHAEVPLSGIARGILFIRLGDSQRQLVKTMAKD